MTKLQQAEIFAKVAHNGQTYGEHDYFFHLNMVKEKVKEYSDDEDVLIAALLHDVIEDTKETYESILTRFGKRVANLCLLLSDREGKNRKERHQKTYPLIALSEDATLIKLCDRFCNVKISVHNNLSKLKMYKKEHDYFKRTFYLCPSHKKLHQEIDNLFVD